MTTQALTLSDSKLPVVRLHATAVYSILNHYIRRNKTQKRVVGTLLGKLLEGNVEVMDCFGIPHEESEDDAGFKVKFKENYHKNMYNFHTRITKLEQVVGWYSTSASDGAPFNDHSTIIDQAYRNECTNPVHLVVDTTLAGDNMGIRAFVCQDMLVGSHNLAKMFHEVKVEMAFSSGERMCIHHMLKDQEGSEAWVSPHQIISAVPSHEDAVKRSMTDLVATIEKVITFTDDVVEDREKASAEVGMALADALGLLMDVRPQDFKEIFHEKTQDFLMISHLSTLLRTQLKVAEAMYSLV